MERDSESDPGRGEFVVGRADPREPVSAVVVSAAAALRGVEPDELDPLSRFVDPDALDNLFCAARDSATADLRVEFTFSGCEVVVDGDGRVAVAPASGSPDDDPRR
ncbi:MAG: HalOD1 output domain-containing protein [Salinigranum sp.]